MNKFVRIVVLSLVLVLALSLGMGTISAQDDESVLVIGWEQEPSQLNPVAGEAFASLMDQFFARDVWNWDRQNQIYPVMVEEVPTLENGLVTTTDEGNTVVEYRLNQGMLWSDGEEVTSDDCLFGHELLSNPETGTLQRGVYPDVVESFEVVDDYNFIMTYNVPFPDFQSSATAMCMLPAHQIRPWIESGEILDTHPRFSGEEVIGYGPYVFSEWLNGDSVQFVRNPNWGGNEFEDAPAWDRVVLRFITESAQMQNAFEVGDIDVAFNFSDDLVEGYREIEGAEVFSTPGVFGDAIWVNVGNGGHPALSEPDVIRALIHAVDRATLAEALIGPGTEVPRSWYSSIFWPPEEELPLIEYNPEEATRLLDEAGWVDSNDDGVRDKDGTELILRFYTTSGRQIREDYQVFIQEYLSEVGVATQLLPVPSGTLFAVFNQRGILSTGDFDLALFALSTDPLSPFANAEVWIGCDGIPSPENPTGRNGWGFCDPEFDALDVQVGVTVDPEERLELAQQAQIQFFEGLFWHGLYLRPTWYAFDSSTIDVSTVQDLGTLSSNYFNKIEFWEPAG
jgi:peptide/nickel transport system substrate-binding protein